MEATVDTVQTVPEEVDKVFVWWEEFWRKTPDHTDVVHLFPQTDSGPALNAYMLALRKPVQVSMQQIRAGCPVYHHQTLILDENAKLAIKKLQQEYIFTQVDKMASAFAVVCKVKVAKGMIHYLTTGGTYAVVADTQDTTCFTLKNDLVNKFSLLYSCDTDVIPPYLPTWKAHSDKFRFIVGANKCLFKPFYLRMTQIF